MICPTTFSVHFFKCNQANLANSIDSKQCCVIFRGFFLLFLFNCFRIILGEGRILLPYELTRMFLHVRDTCFGCRTLTDLLFGMFSDSSLKCCGHSTCLQTPGINVLVVQCRYLLGRQCTYSRHLTPIF